MIYGLLYGQSDIYNSRKTAITKAIEKVGPAVASINVEQTVSAFSSPDPFFRYFFEVFFWWHWPPFEHPRTEP